MWLGIRSYFMHLLCYLKTSVFVGLNAIFHFKQNSRFFFLSFFFFFSFFADNYSIMTRSQKKPASVRSKLKFKSYKYTKTT